MLITIKYTRPSTNVSWWTTIMPLEIKDHYQATYITPGHLIEESFVESQDGLELTHIGHWSGDPDVLTMFLVDPVVNAWKGIRAQHCSENGILAGEADIVE